MKSMKKSLFACITALVFSLCAFVGVTFAWFSDEAEIKDNTITSGTLDISVDNTAPLFSNDDGVWYPGRSLEKSFKITNSGDLMFRYSLTVSKLTAGAIENGGDVEYPNSDSKQTLADRLQVSLVADGVEHQVGTLAALYGVNGYVGGDNTLSSGDTKSFKVIIKMTEGEDDNLYQGLSAKFTIALKAEQMEAPVSAEAFAAAGYEVVDNSNATAEDVQNAVQTGKAAIMQDVNIGAESIVVESDKTVYLALQGDLVSGSASARAAAAHTIDNSGTLVISGNGKIDNLTMGGGVAAVYNRVGGTMTINGAEITKSNDKESDASGSRSWYVLVNQGTMTINNANIHTVAMGSDKGSSLIENGWYTKSDNTTKATAKLTINGGTFKNGLLTVKNDEFGELEINGGTFTNEKTQTLINWNIATINGGVFVSDSYAAVANDAYDAESAVGQLTVNGGKFVSANKYDFITHGYDTSYGLQETVSVRGGTFSSSTFSSTASNKANVVVADGYEAVDNGDGTWSVKKAA